VTVIASVGLASIAPAHCDDVVAPQVAALAAQLDPRVPEMLAFSGGSTRASPAGVQEVAVQPCSGAGADWEAAGWAAELDAAVRAASDRFAGPLAYPPAPWHHTYLP
jgi:hypothetical protein